MNAARRGTATIFIVTAAVLGEREELLGQPALQRQTVQAGLATDFAYGPEGTFRGQNCQAARTALLSLQFEF